MESLRGILLGDIFKGHIQFNSVEELKEEMVRYWDNIEQSEAKYLYKYGPERIANV